VDCSRSRLPDWVQKAGCATQQIINSWNNSLWYTGNLVLLPSESEIKLFGRTPWRNVWDLHVIHVLELIRNSCNKTNKWTDVIIYFYTKSVRTPSCFDLCWSSSGSYLTSIKHLWKHGAGWEWKHILLTIKLGTRGRWMDSFTIRRMRPGMHYIEDHAKLRTYLVDGKETNVRPWWNGTSKWLSCFILWTSLL
jgi:hypothetical protein